MPFVILMNFSVGKKRSQGTFLKMSGSRECKVCNTVNSSAPALQAGALPVHQLLTGDNSCQIRAPRTESRNKSRLFACRDCYYLESKDPTDRAELGERVPPEPLWRRDGQMFQGGCAQQRPVPCALCLGGKGESWTVCCMCL